MGLNSGSAVSGNSPEEHFISFLIYEGTGENLYNDLNIC